MIHRTFEYEYFLGEEVMTNEYKDEKLFFLGAQNLGSNWRVHFKVLKDIPGIQVKDSFDIYLDIKEEDKLRFGYNFGEWECRSFNTGFLNRKIETTKYFCRYETIKIIDIEKDRIEIRFEYDDIWKDS